MTISQLYDLNEFVDPKNYKSYDELKQKLERVLGEASMAGAATIKQETMMNDPAPAVEPVTAEQMNSADTDDTMSYFARLANED